MIEEHPVDLHELWCQLHDVVKGLLLQVEIQVNKFTTKFYLHFPPVEIQQILGDHREGLLFLQLLVDDTTDGGDKFQELLEGHTLLESFAQEQDLDEFDLLILLLALLGGSGSCEGIVFVQEELHHVHE